jgi:hypothetical protein
MYCTTIYCASTMQYIICMYTDIDIDTDTDIEVVTYSRPCMGDKM